MSRFRRFGMDENGAVTAEWVVLTASVLLLVMVAINGVLKDAVLDVAEATAAELENPMPPRCANPTRTTWEC